MSFGGGAGQGRGQGQGQHGESSTPFDQFQFHDPSTPLFTPFNGWEDGHPPWQQSSQQLFSEPTDPFLGFPSHQPQPQAPSSYISPYINIADDNRVVEPFVNPWDVFGGPAALAPIVREEVVPERETRWLGPQPTQIPLAQQFERGVNEWRGERPPTVQEQRGRAAQMLMPRHMMGVGFGEGYADVGAGAGAGSYDYGGMGMGMEMGMRMGMGMGMQGPSQQFGPLQQQQQQYQYQQQPQQQQQQQYARQNVSTPRPARGQPSQQPNIPRPQAAGPGPGRTVWEQQNLIRPPGPPTWKDTRAFGEGVFDVGLIKQLESGDFSQHPNIEAIDEGPRKPNETITAWRTRVVTSRKALGIENSELRARPYSFPTTAKQATDTPEQFKARLAARRKVKAQWEKDKEVHKNKMDHTHQAFDPEYATQYRAEKAARQFQNAKRRKTALLIARRIAERDNLPRPGTPELPEDSSDEDLPAMPPKDRGAFAGGPGPRPKRCLYCKHMRKPCTLVVGSPRPCERCKQRGIVCEIARDLADPNAAKPAWKTKPKKRKAVEEEEEEEEEEEDDEEDEEDEEPISAQEKASLLRKKRATFNTRSRTRKPQRHVRRRSASPEVESLPSIQCRPCKDQSRPCDGERPCGTCRLNGTEDMCSPVSHFSRYRERDYREAGGSLQPAFSGGQFDWEDMFVDLDDPSFDVEWENLVDTPEAAKKAIESMDLGPMMNYSSAVIQDSIEAGNQNSFFQGNADNSLLAMEPYQPTPGGPSYNRLGVVVEPDASYTSLAPTGPEFTAEPFGDVAFYSDQTFGGEGMDFADFLPAPEYSVERPDYPDDGIDGVLEAVERRRSGFEAAAAQEDPDPDPSLKGLPLSDYRREWEQNLKGIMKNKHCDEVVGVDICFKSPAKHCDYLQHGIEGGEWHPLCALSQRSECSSGGCTTNRD
ncbi:hypothetical protein SBOR_9600 [Sclerotinia borealis F-4128]|uniref:Zn(2)-C6 fungal-type domain-containing protein n=1 Tax=Sclerotinia borealis (strain F-4128) TaxID=1432307 RepID=W9BZL4_SCLBF|nr:hypothetical protein SBOR_9600 [Sclerotinia borealis F-4128]